MSYTCHFHKVPFSLQKKIPRNQKSPFSCGKKGILYVIRLIPEGIFLSSPQYIHSPSHLHPTVPIGSIPHFWVVHGKSSSFFFLSFFLSLSPLTLSINRLGHTFLPFLLPIPSACEEFSAPTRTFLPPLSPLESLQTPLGGRREEKRGEMSAKQTFPTGKLPRKKEKPPLPPSFLGCYGGYGCVRPQPAQPPYLHVRLPSVQLTREGRREEKISSSTFYQMGWRKFTFSYRTVRIRRVEMVLVYR